MKDINVITLKGRFGKDPELRQTANGKSVAYFSLANNRDWGSEENQKHVNWFQCRAYGNLAEKIIMPYCKSGTQVIINGELRQDSWKDEQGNYQNLISVLVTDLNFAGNNSNKTSSNQSSIVNSQNNNINIESKQEFVPYDEFDDSIF